MTPIFQTCQTSAPHKKTEQQKGVEKRLGCLGYYYTQELPISEVRGGREVLGYPLAYPLVQLLPCIAEAWLTSQCCGRIACSSVKLGCCASSPPRNLSCTCRLGSHPKSTQKALVLLFLLLKTFSIFSSKKPRRFTNPNAVGPED